MKIVTVGGARTQFVKAAAVSRIFAVREDIGEVLVHTGQHFDANMSRIFFDGMEIPPSRYNLDIHSLSHGAMTGRMFEGGAAVVLMDSLAGAERVRILAAYEQMRSVASDFSADLYGCGFAAQRTVDAILTAWGG